MTHNFYLSCIRNIQTDYAEVLKMILGENDFGEYNSIRKNTYFAKINMSLSEKIIEQYINFIDISVKNGRIESSILNEGFVRAANKIEYESEKTIYYLLYVVCDDYGEELQYIEDDVINLQYFSLLRQALGEIKETKNIKLMLFISPNLKRNKLNGDNFNKLYYKSSQFLHNEIQKHKSCYYAFKFYGNEFKLSEMNSNQNGIWRKFSPLVEIANYRDLEMWSYVIDDLYKKKESFLLENVQPEELYSLVYYKSVHTKIIYKNEDYVFCENSQLYNMLKLCKAYFCEIPSVSGRRKTKNKRTKADMEKDLVHFFNFNLYEYTKDMTLLGFYILCIFIYFSRTSVEEDYGKLKKKKIFELKFIANDIADGLLQLLENLVSHSQFGKGFLSFRIHTNKDGNNNYLRSKYKNYFINDSNLLEKPYFLEAQIVDFSFFGIMQKYLEDMSLKQSFLGKEDKQIIDKVKEDVKSFPLKAMFCPNDEQREVFHKYNKIYNNYIHHYGLQLFFSLIENNEGCFIVKSMGFNGDIDKNIYANINLAGKSAEYLPGTQYSILLPFEYKSKQEPTSLNADINYVNYLEKEFAVINYPNEFSKKEFEKNSVDFVSFNNNWQRKKELIIDKISKQIIDFYDNYDQNENEEDKIIILNFDARKIELGCIEYFCKACISFGIFKENLTEIPLAIYNCSENHFMSIVRMFAVLYDKLGETDIMKKMQIYLVGKDAGEEFIITGKNIRTAISSAQKLAFTRGVNGKYISLLSNMLKHRSINYEIENVKFIPFDLEITYDDNKSPFERGVMRVLEREISDDLFGCKISNAHMRLGSKIHIKDFYEAELLFHNNYYTSGFSYQIIKEMDQDGIDFNKPIMIVGYDTYSEMLLYEIVNLMKKRCNYKNITYKDIDYMYYENKENTFRIFNNKNIKEIPLETQYVVIVPINSTLTTHDKLIALIKNSIMDGKKPNIVEKIAVVLIRDSGEKKDSNISDLESGFWEEVIENDKSLPVVKTKKISDENMHEIKFIISLETEWLDPLKCKYCFPSEEKNMYYVEELPLIETNKASVVPIQKIQLRNTKITNVNIQDSNFHKINNMRVESLSKYLIYKHVERNNNHYTYYFETEKFMKGEKDQIGKWLKDECESKIQNESGKLVYDILVAPLHYSNSAFVEEVNMRVFNGASLVLHFDIEKEFRDNIKTKFSNIKLLYENLSNSNQKAVIRFHYVDDTIISGNTFYRMRSVIQSIFSREMIYANVEKTGVEINIFYSIFLLLNRCSKTTKYNYIDNLDYYFSYVDLFISSMRNHEDACVLCKALDEYKRLRNTSATNNLIQYWNHQIDKHKIYKLPSNNVFNGGFKDEVEFKTTSQEMQERARKRIICSHNATIQLQNVSLSNYDDFIYIKEIKNQIVNNLFFSNTDLSENEQFEYILSYIKVLSRPFFVYSRDIRNAIFSLMLDMLDYILFGESSIKNGNTIKIHDKLVEWLKPYCYDNLHKKRNEVRFVKDAYVLLITLMKRLSGLGSSYIIRKRNIEKIYDYFCTLSENNLSKLYNSELNNKFINRYLAMVKRNMSLSNDEMKCVYLEYLILYGKEYNSEETKCKNLLDNDSLCLYQYFFLENNRVIIDAINDLQKDIDIRCYNEKNLTENNIIETLNRYYYYLNFRRLLSYYGFSTVDEGQEFKINKFNNFSVIKSLICLSNELRRDNKDDVADRYSKIRDYICGITSAKDVNILVTDVNILSTGEEHQDQVEGYKLAESKNERFHPKVKINISLESSQLNTYIMEDDYQGTRVIVSTNNQAKHNRSISFELQYIDKNRRDIFIGLKLFLAFWSKLIDYMEVDLKNNLIEKWKAAQEFQYQITKSRAKDHTDDDVLHMELHELCKTYKEKIPECNEVHQMLRLIVNMYIARLNVRSLIFENQGFSIAGEIVQRAKGKCKFADLYDEYLYSMINILNKGYNFKIYYDNEENSPVSILKRTVRYVEDNEKITYPPLHHLAVIIIECFFSAIKNGKREKDENNDEMVRIDVCISEEYFIIKNSLQETELSGIKEKIKKAIQRENDGISLVTIYRYFKDFYKTNNEVFIDINESEKKFVIKLPIVQKKKRRVVNEINNYNCG